VCGWGDYRVQITPIVLTSQVDMLLLVVVVVLVAAIVVIVVVVAIFLQGIRPGCVKRECKRVDTIVSTTKILVEVIEEKGKGE